MQMRRRKENIFFPPGRGLERKKKNSVLSEELRLAEMKMCILYKERQNVHRMLH
jgi:hypothetical protein